MAISIKHHSLPSGFVAAESGAEPGADGVLVLDARSAPQLVVPGGGFLLLADYARDGADLVLTGEDGQVVVILDYFALEAAPLLLTELGAQISPELAARLAGPALPLQYAQAQPAAPAEPVGQVVELEGEVVAQRSDGSRETLAQGSPVYLGDVLETASGATVNVRFVDGTRFVLGEAARMTIDELVYAPDGSEGSALFTLVNGTFSFVSGAVAHTAPDAMQIRTPVATIGIRGTTLLLKITQAPPGLTVSILKGDPLTDTSAIQLFDNISGAPIDTPLSVNGETLRITPGQPPQRETLSPDQLQQEFGVDAVDAAQKAEAQETEPGAGEGQALAAPDGSEVFVVTVGPDGQLSLPPQIAELIQVITFDTSEAAEEADGSNPFGNVTDNNNQDAGLIGTGAPGGGPPGGLVYNFGDGSVTKLGGSGNDTLVINGNPAGGPITFATVGTSVEVTLGDGAVLTFDEVENVQINTGAGDDTVNIPILLAGTAISNDTITINTGAGDDAVNAPTDRTLVVNTDGGNDTIVAGSQGDTLDGGDDNDTITGNGGNDTIIGGAGEADTAVYTGDSSDYAIDITDGSGTVQDLREGSPDGTDTLSGIEFLTFSDGTIPSGAEIPGPSWSITGDATVTEGGAAGYTVSFDGVTLGPGQTVSIDLAIVFPAGGASAADFVDSFLADVQDAIDALGETGVSLTGSTLTFSDPGETSFSFSLPTAADAIVEGDEAYSVQISNPQFSGGSPGSIAPATADTAIEDASVGGLSWTITGDAAVSEGDAASYTVSYDGVVLADGQVASIDLAIVFPAAGASAADFDETFQESVQAAITAQGLGDVVGFDGTTLTLAGGVDEFTFSLPVAEDDLFEGAEPYSVQISNSQVDGVGAGGIATPSAATTIAADPLPEPVWTIDGPDSVAEGEAAEYEISHDADLPDGLSVSIDLSLIFPAEGGADAADFEEAFLTSIQAAIDDLDGETGVSLAGNTLIFSDPGETEFSFSLPVAEDELFEGDEDYTVQISNPQADGQSSGDIDGAVVTTTIEGDALPEPAWTIQGDAAVTEGGAAEYTVSHDALLPDGLSASIDLSILFPPAGGASAADFEEAFLTSVADAANGTDGVSLTGSTLTLDAGVNSFSFSLPTLDDDIVEPSELYQVQISNPEVNGESSGSIVAPPLASTVIQDNDVAGNAFTPTGDAQALAEAVMAGLGGVEVFNASFTGSASTFGNLDLDGPSSSAFNFGSGILLTSGDPAPPVTNTSTFFTGIASGAGDADLNALAGTVTTDASVLTFNFTAPAGTTAVAFTFMYGTEEFPDQGVTDIAGVFVDGANALTFPNGSLVQFVNGVNNGFFTDNANGQLAIEYDGVSAPNTVVGFLNPEAEGGVHTIKIAVSDTGDQSFDSGLFIKATALSEAPPLVNELLALDLAPLNAAAAVWSISGDDEVLEGETAGYSVGYTGVTLALGQTVSIVIAVALAGGADPAEAADFAGTLSDAMDIAVDGVAGVSWDGEAGQLTFTGEAAVQSIDFDLPTFDDGVAEGNEAFTVELSDPQFDGDPGGAIAPGADIVTTTIIDNDFVEAFVTQATAFLSAVADDGVISGTPGDDLLQGTDGEDVMQGGAGNDVLLGSPNPDVLDGGADSDTADYSDSPGPVSVDLSSAGPHSGGDAEGDTLISIENVTGSAFDDALAGNDGANALDGGDGADTLDGGDGADFLDGGPGPDALTGGEGPDEFFSAGPGDGTAAGAGQPTTDFDGETDQISDFTSGEDSIVLGDGFGLEGPVEDGVNFQVIGGTYDDGATAQVTASEYQAGNGTVIVDGNGMVIHDANGAGGGYTIVADVGPGTVVDDTDLLNLAATS